MKSLSVLLILLLSSCHMGKYYAHQRKGGKKTEEEKTLLAEKIILYDSNQTSSSKKIFLNQEMTNVDTLYLKNLTSIPIKEKVHTKKKIGTSLPFSYKKTKRTVLAEKIITRKNKTKRFRGIKTSAMKDLDSYWVKVIFMHSSLDFLYFFFPIVLVWEFYRCCSFSWRG